MVKSNYGFCRRVLIPVLLVILAFALFGSAWAQEGVTLSKIQGGIQDVNAGILKLVKGVMGLIMFGTAVWQFIEGYTSGNLNSKWMSIIGIAIFLIGLSMSDKVYSALIGGTTVTRETGGTSIDWGGTPVTE
jgi:hypothetical protein